MDYHNADGSTSEMCGNGIRVFAEHLRREGAVDVTAPLPIATRGGTKTLTWSEGRFTVDMGVADVRGRAHLGRGARRPLAGTHGQHGQPPRRRLRRRPRRRRTAPRRSPAHDAGGLPRTASTSSSSSGSAPQHVAMRVHERGSGETRSCGTGACAVMVASALADGDGPGSTYVVDVPGGRLEVTWTDAGTRPADRPGGAGRGRLLVRLTLYLVRPWVADTGGT